MPGALPLVEISFNFGKGKIEWTYTLMDHETGKSIGNVKADWNIVRQRGHFITPYRRFDDYISLRLHMQNHKNSVLSGQGGNCHASRRIIASWPAY
jgi:hypothetical protein